MQYLTNKTLPLAAAISGIIALSSSAYADSESQSLQSEVQMLRKEVAELRALIKEQSSAQEEVKNLRNEVKATSHAQSEWTNADSTFHLSGYAAAGYTDRKQSGGSAFNVASFNPIFNFLYRDIVLAEAELEVATAADGSTETKLEYGSIDIFLNDYATLVAGKFLSPLGHFRQNAHPAWINKFPSLPPGFGEDQAAPAAEVGLGVRGGYPFGQDMKMKYALYAGNGPELEVDAGEIHGIKSDGFARDVDRRKVLGGRVSLVPLPKFEIGLSGASGGVGLANEPDRSYRAIGTDIGYQWKNLDLRAEYISQKVGDQEASAAPLGGTWKAWYGQAAYRFLPSKWEGVLRYGKYESPRDSQRQKQWAVGVNYLWGPSVMAKLGYEFNRGLAGQEADANRWLLQLAYGF
ncbi:MAG: porin [Sulfuricella denitrificans]|nr:porin [Sulfuricella denitrificans]